MHSGIYLQTSVPSSLGISGICWYFAVAESQGYEDTTAVLNNTQKPTRNNLNHFINLS